MTAISQRQYARWRGVSEKTVNQWRRKGRVALLPDGHIDKELSDEMLDARPLAYRGGVIGGTPKGWSAAGACADMTLAELEEAVERMAAEYER
jgi:hypothetical protein